MISFSCIGFVCLEGGESLKYRHKVGRLFYVKDGILTELLVLV